MELATTVRIEQLALARSSAPIPCAAYVARLDSAVSHSASSTIQLMHCSAVSFQEVGPLSLASDLMCLDPAEPQRCHRRCRTLRTPAQDRAAGGERAAAG